MSNNGLHPFSTTQDALALAFAGAHRERLRYVAEWKRWMEWDGTRWRPDRTLLAADLARTTCGREAAAVREAEPPSIAARVVHRLGSAATPAAVERLARSDRMLAAQADQWDRDPDLINTPDGIIDTRSGDRLPHRADSYMTRIAAVGPAAPGTPHPAWSRFLDRITGGDHDLAFYLQRLAGYALTGHATEHALFFAHGIGANGKTTFIGTLARILGDYADATSLDMLAAASPRARAAERARLAGARLVVVEDASDGRPWPAAHLAALTGSDALVAGDARHRLAAMTPGFKLLVAGTERPSLARVDEALRRRLHLVPFAVTIPEAERDRDLARKLEAEHPAILRWAIDGAIAWRRIGLDPPAAVRDAGAHHLAAEDTVAQWLEDSTARSATAWSSSAALYGSWTSWCRTAGERPGSQKRFGQILEARGFVPSRRHGGVRGYLGIALRDEATIIADMVRDVVAEKMRDASRSTSNATAPAAIGHAENASPRVTASTLLPPSPCGRGIGGGMEQASPLPRESNSVVTTPPPIPLPQGEGGRKKSPHASLAFAREASKTCRGEARTGDLSAEALAKAEAGLLHGELRLGVTLPCSDLFPSWPPRPCAPRLAYPFSTYP